MPEFSRSSTSVLFERLKLQVAEWLHSLLRPIGISTSSDFDAAQLLDLCRELEIPVPEEMAILGNGNERLICESTRHTISSIDAENWRVGYEAITKATLHQQWQCANLQASFS